MEELISAYIDNELSPQNRAKVESLVRHDVQAKNILQGYLLVRKTFKNLAPQKAPQNLCASVLSAIDTAQPANACAQNMERNDDLRRPVFWSFDRFKNPRIYAYPLAVLICAVFIGIYSHNTQPPGNSPSDGPNTVAVLPPDAKNSEAKIHAPMSSKSTWETQIVQAPSEFDRLTVNCRVKTTSKMNTVFPQLFAAESVTWSKFTSGKSTTVYETQMNVKTLRSLLNEFSQKEIEMTDETVESLLEKWKNVPESKEIKVLFSVETP